MVNETYQQNPSLSSVGNLRISLELSDENQITNVSINNTRPQRMGRFFLGKTKEQVLETIPKVFLLCSQAQQTAAISAMNQAPLTAQQTQHLANRCALEWLKEHSWQLWQMGREQLGDSFAINEHITLSRYLLKQLQQAQKDVNSTPDPIIYRGIMNLLAPLLGCSATQFLNYSWLELEEWYQGNSPYAQLFKALQHPTMMMLGSANDWDVQFEDGTLSRQLQHPLVSHAFHVWQGNAATRTLARWIEMITVCIDPTVTMSQVSGQALTSRGILNHHVSMDNEGVIREYEIDAPTDRLFSPNGLVCRTLQGQFILDRKSEWVRPLIWSIDPCVEFIVEIKHGQ